MSTVNNANNVSTQIVTVYPLRTLYDDMKGTRLPLPPELASFYGELSFPLSQDRPHVIANLVTSLDGVVSLGVPGKASGKEISGSNKQDRAVMGILRSVADAVVVGAGTLREGTGNALTAASVYPPLAGAYATLREVLNKEGDPLSVIVTASGNLDPSLQILSHGGPVLVVTTQQGAKHLRDQGIPTSVLIAEVASNGSGAEGLIPAKAILEAIAKIRACAIILVEGGPHLLGDFFAESTIDEQFLTLSPQIVGRDSHGTGKRLSLVEGQTFAPERPLWGRLSAVKQSESHLFLRYTFDDTTASTAV